MADDNLELELESPKRARSRTRESRRSVWLRKPRQPFQPIRYSHEDASRFTADQRKPNDERTEFERDRDRIIHSSAFRRLQGKTQVFGVREGDFFRTRLTHSLEVAQIAKGLALRLGSDTDLVEAAALSHDMGHPAFGHAGEDELRSLMMDYGGFEANAQNLRILTYLEKKSTKYEGLNLTRATLDAQLKYKQPFQAGRRKFFYESSRDAVEWINKHSEPTPEDQSFECQIMDWADQVAYGAHDLEDAIHGGFITLVTLSDPSLRESIISDVLEREADEGRESVSRQDLGAVWDGLINFIRQEDFDFGGVVRPASLNDRKKHRKMLTSALISRYIKAVGRDARPGAGSIETSERYKYRIETPDEIRWEIKLLNRAISRVVIQSPQVVSLEEKGRHIIRSLFAKFFEGFQSRTAPPR